MLKKTSALDDKDELKSNVHKLKKMESDLSKKAKKLESGGFIFQFIEG